MDISWYYNLLLLFILFLLSAFFSGSEVALFSLNRNKLKNSLSGNPIIERYLIRLLDFPRRLLVTILLGNTFVNVAASIVAVALTLQLADYYKISNDLALTIQIILLTILIVLIGELIPKVWASKNSLSFAKFVSIPLYWTSVVLFPISESFTELIKYLVSKLKYDKTKLVISHEEISELASLGQERGTIEEDESSLIQSIVTFKDVSVYEIMTPRVDIISISVDASFDKVIKIITSSGHSRIPLYKNNLDEIIGIIYAKDILPFLQKKELRNKLYLPKIARKAMFVPTTKKIDDLLHEFQEKKMHIAVVVDEYGGTAGLISLEDILEEIIGEIRDEYDKEENPINKLNDNTYMVLGKLTIDDLNELLNTTIASEDEDFETVAGLVLNHAGNFPKEGYSFKLENHKFTVKEVLKKRIKKVLVEKFQGE